MMYWGNGGVDWWGWLLMAFGMVAFWGVIIWVIVSLVRLGTPTRTTSFGDESPSPEDVLKRRFAAGEIDEDEYTRRLEILRGKDRVPTG